MCRPLNVIKISSAAALCLLSFSTAGQSPQKTKMAVRALDPYIEVQKLKSKDVETFTQEQAATAGDMPEAAEINRMFSESGLEKEHKGWRQLEKDLYFMRARSARDRNVFLQTEPEFSAAAKGKFWDLVHKR